jgi:hypothetical protein
LRVIWVHASNDLTTRTSLILAYQGPRRYFMSQRVQTLKAIRAKIRPEPPKASHPSGEPVREPLQDAVKVF